MTLNWAEASAAAREGVQRHIRALAKHRNPRHGWDASRDLWSTDIEAAAAELALAKAIRSYWAPNPEPDYEGDVAGGWHVRHTMRADGGLIVYPDDPDTGRFALVIGCIPEFEIRGWTFGQIAKRDEWKAGDRLRSEGFIVPQQALRPLSDVERIAA